jgi:hypothetical protein
VKSNPPRDDRPASAGTAITGRPHLAKAHPASEPAPGLSELTGTTPAGLVAAWTRFWFSPTSPLGLHWLRFLSGLLFLSWLLPLTGEREALFGLDGLVDATAYIEASRLPNGPPVPIGWSILYMAGSNATMFELLWWGSLAVLVLFTLGVATRITSVCTWLVIVSFLASPAAQADTDYLLGILAFYLMLGYFLLGLWSRPLTWLERLLGPRGTSVLSALRRQEAEPTPSYAANFAVRLLQINVVIVVVTSGLHKLQFGDWWAGVAYWYPLHPPLQMDAARLQAAKRTGDATLFVLSVVGYLVLAWQLTFPLIAYQKRLRWLLLTGALVGGVGSILLFGDPTFGPFFALACLCYLTPEEWARVSGWVSWPLERRNTGAVEAAGPRKPRVNVAL